MNDAVLCTRWFGGWVLRELVDGAPIIGFPRYMHTIFHPTDRNDSGAREWSVPNTI